MTRLNPLHLLFCTMSFVGPAIAQDDPANEILSLGGSWQTNDFAGEIVHQGASVSMNIIVLSQATQDRFGYQVGDWILRGEIGADRSVKGAFHARLPFGTVWDNCPGKREAARPIELSVSEDYNELSGRWHNQEWNEECELSEERWVGITINRFVAVKEVKFVVDEPPFQEKLAEVSIGDKFRIRVEFIAAPASAKFPVELNAGQREISPVETTKTETDPKSYLSDSVQLAKPEPEKSDVSLH